MIAVGSPPKNIGIFGTLIFWVHFVDNIVLLLVTGNFYIAWVLLNFYSAIYHRETLYFLSLSIHYSYKSYFSGKNFTHKTYKILKDLSTYQDIN